MLPASVMSDLPFGIDDWPLSRLDDAVASSKAGFSCGVDEIHMRPVVAVVMDIVRNFAEQDALWRQHAVRLGNKWRIGVSERIAVLFWRSDDKSESHVEVLLVVLALIWDVRWIVHDYVECAVAEWHLGIVGREVGPMRNVDIKPKNWPGAPTPKPSTVHSGIKDAFRALTRIEVKQELEELCVIPFPHRTQRSVPNRLAARAGELGCH